MNELLGYINLYFLRMRQMIVYLIIIAYFSDFPMYPCFMDLLSWSFNAVSGIICKKVSADVLAFANIYVKPEHGYIRKLTKYFVNP